MTVTIMTLQNLPPEVLMMIALHIAQTESDGDFAKAAARLCYFSNEEDEHHSTSQSAINNLLLARSPSFWNFASVSRQIRNVLFTSPDSKSITVKYDGMDCQKAKEIPTFLLAKVNTLHLVCTKPETSGGKDPDASVPLVDVPTASSYRGIGDILLPYYLLESLDIRWRILKEEDPRIKAMEDCANATPVMRLDFIRFSRPCMMSTLVDLHIDLGHTPYLTQLPKSQQEADQLDLILQQFDLPALRNFHLSYRTDIPVEWLVEHWSGILPAIHVHHWPCLQTVQICFLTRYRFGSYPERRKSIWLPLAQNILDHLATFRKPLKVDINILWEFPSHTSAFVMTSGGTVTLCEQIMPTLQTFTDFVNGLEGRSKTRAFSLQSHGKFGSHKTEFRSSVRPADGEASIQYEVTQDGIHEVFASVVSQNGTLVTTTDLYIQVPVDRQQREGFLRQHGLQWDEVEWDDEEAEIEEESESDESDDSDTSHGSSAEEGFEEEYEEGEENGEVTYADKDEAEKHSSETNGRDSSTPVDTEEPTAALHTIVRIQVPSGIDDHDAWLRQHRLGPDSAMWADVAQADNGDEPLIGVGIQIDTDVHRENARHFDPSQVMADFRERIALQRLAWNGNDVENQNDGDRAEEVDALGRARVGEAADDDDDSTDGNDA